MIWVLVVLITVAIVEAMYILVLIKTMSEMRTPYFEARQRTLSNKSGRPDSTVANSEHVIQPSPNFDESV